MRGTAWHFVDKGRVLWEISFIEEVWTVCLSVGLLGGTEPHSWHMVMQA